MKMPHSQSDYVNGPRFPEAKIKAKPHSQKTNFDIIDFFDKINGINNFPNEIAFSSIEKKENSNFMGEDSEREFIGVLPKHEQLKLKGKTRIVHIKSDNFDSFCTNFSYLCEGIKYNYFFVYHDHEKKLYIQVQYTLPRKINFDKMREYYLLPPIEEYYVLKNLLDNKKIDNVKINSDKHGINLGRGAIGGVGAKINSYLANYCMNENINLYKKFQ